MNTNTPRIPAKGEARPVRRPASSNPLRSETKSSPKQQTRPSFAKKTYKKHSPSRKPSPSHSKQSKPIEAGRVRIIPLGGVEEVGRNMTIIEYGNDLVILDAGFQFPTEETPGIDYIVPNTTYLEERKDKIRGIIISHGHLDHVGAIPYIIEKIGLPPIYTTSLTKAMILKRQEEFPHAQTLDVQQIKSGQTLKLGQLKLRFFDITHTIPDAIGTIVETPMGNIIYPGDFKIEVDTKGKPLEVDAYNKIGKENNLVLLLESTNSEVPGFSIPEKTAHKNLERVIGLAKGRVLVGTFSSLLERIIELIKIAEKYDRKVIIDGRSMKANVEIASTLGIFKPKPNIIIPKEKINDYAPEKVLVICTGAQGEKNASLMRLASRRDKHIKLQPQDTIILSSSIIPGNERSIQGLKDNLARQGAKIIHYGVEDVHASGHAYQEELKLMIKMIKPKFLIPLHGHYFMLKTNADLAESTGMAKDKIVVPFNNGAIIEAEKDKIHTRKESVPSNYVMVDGLGVGDVQEVVMRDRQMLAQDGIFVVITVIDSQTGKVKNSPDIISRGFIYLRESQDLLRQTRFLIKRTVEEATGKMHPINMSYVKELLRDNIGKFLFQKTKRRPMVLPVIIEV